MDESQNVSRVESSSGPVHEVQGQPRLKQNFSFLSALGMAICCSGAWEGWTASLAQGIAGGSAVGLIYGWIFVSIGIACVAGSLCEMASLWPSAAGQGYWTYQLAPAKYKNVLGWYNAWLTIAALLLGAISCVMGVALQVLSYVSVCLSSYEMQRWHAFLLTVVVIILWIVINIFFLHSMHWANESIIYLHVAGFLAAIITLAVCTKDKHSAKWVFTHFENNTGWPSDSMAWMTGLLSSVFAFFSIDSATHYSEEIPDQARTVPRVIIWQVCLNGLLTIPFIVTVLFCMGDPLAVLSSPIGLTSPFTQIALNSTGSPVAAIALNVVSTWTALVCGMDLWGGAARIIYALARDGALPSTFSKLHPRYNVPIPAILVLTPPAVLICFIYVWNTTAFYAIMSCTLVVFQLSYAMPILLKNIHGRKLHSFEKAPWNMGAWGWAVDAVALIWGSFISIVMCFPSMYPVTAANMNYSVAIVGAILLFSTVSWFTYGRSNYVGLDNGSLYGVQPINDVAVTNEQSSKGKDNSSA